jgi:hypothetical protein
MRLNAFLVQKYNGNGGNDEAVIYTSLDESALANDEDSSANIHCGDAEDIAKRDIAKGEEITCNYADFVSLGWDELDL